jgi:oligopeptide transport system ATP-binding protein
VKELYKWFEIRGGLLSRTIGYVKAVDGVSFGVKRGETLGLVGESGSGKTTIARVILRLIDATRGEIFLEGQSITKLKGRRLSPFRRKMQIVFQDPYASLDSRQRVRSIIEEPMKIHHTTSSRREADEAAASLISKVGLNVDHLLRFPHEFSGGQRQRIAVARALAVNPEFLILDEPTSSLDVSVQAQILNLLKALQKEFNLTYLFISHNLSVIKHMCDRVAVMYLGRIMEVADADDLFANPKHPYTYALLSAIPQADPEKRSKRMLLEGDVPSPVNIPPGCRFRTRCPYATKKCEEEFPVARQVSRGHWIECHYDIDFKTAKRIEPIQRVG